MGENCVDGLYWAAAGLAAPPIKASNSATAPQYRYLDEPTVLVFMSDNPCDHGGEELYANDIHN